MYLQIQMLTHFDDLINIVFDFCLYVYSMYKTASWSVKILL